MLDSKTSLNINIFLKQFRASNKEVIAILVQGNTERISLEQLKAFEKLLPDRGTVSLIMHIPVTHDMLQALMYIQLYRSTHSSLIMEIKLF